MNQAKIDRNKEKIRTVYQGDPGCRAAFSVVAPMVPAFSHPLGEYTLSEKPIELWMPWAVKNYQSQLDWFEKVDHDGVPQVPIISGTHIYAAAFGCPVKTTTNNNPFALPLVKTAEEADALEEPDLWNSPAIHRVFELVRAVQKELGPEVDFGCCDMQTGFDTAALIWDKEALFCALTDSDLAPAAQRLVDKCARFLKKVLVELRREFPTMSPCHWPPVWCPPELAPWVSNDECGALGTAMFQEFCLPELKDLSATFGGLGMHCCASAEHQFEAFTSIPGFYGFNRVPALQGLDSLFPMFGGPKGPVLVLAHQSLDTFEALMRTAPQGTRFLLDVTQPTPEESQRAVDRFRAL